MTRPRAPRLPRSRARSHALLARLRAFVAPLASARWAARRAVAVPDRTVVIGCDQAGLVQPGRKGRWRSRAIFAAAWHRCRSSALRCLPRPGSGSPVLEEAARELEAAAHDARVAFDCVALGELDRAHTSALTARVAADAAVTALQAALLAASTAAGS